jgi:hypothetical protein
LFNVNDVWADLSRPDYDKKRRFEINANGKSRRYNESVTEKRESGNTAVAAKRRPDMGTANEHTPFV